MWLKCSSCIFFKGKSKIIEQIFCFSNKMLANANIELGSNTMIESDGKNGNFLKNFSRIWIRWKFSTEW